MSFTVEFENNQPADDEQRRLAEAKKITLQPLHTGITPDPFPDAEIGARKTVETTPNISNDTESTDPTRLVQPSKSALAKASQAEPAPRTNSRSSALVLLAAALAAIGATAWLWIQAA